MVRFHVLSNRHRVRRVAFQCLAGAAVAAAVGGGGLLLLRQHKRTRPPSVKGQGNVPEVYGTPYQPITAAALAKDVELCRQRQLQRLIGLGVSVPVAQAAADAAAAVVACEILDTSWAEKVAAACPNLGPSSALFAAAKSGAPLELHMHLKDIFCASLRAALLSGVAALQHQQVKQPQGQLLQPETDIHWLLLETETVFKDVFYDPTIRAAASACDFAQPAHELLLTLQKIRAPQPAGSSVPTGSLLPLLLTGNGREALEAFIAAVDKQVLGSLCSSWERSGVLHKEAHQQQREHEGPPRRVRQLSARNTGKDAGTPMALSSYADAAERADLHSKAPLSAPLFLRASDIKAASESISKHGFCVIKNALTPEQLQEVQQATFASSETGICVRDADNALALAQPWHRDNSHRGLTVVLPLVHIDPRNGPTELLPGSHVLSGEEGENWLKWLCLIPVFLKTVVAGGSTVKAEIQPGDALVYDSRLLHRGQDILRSLGASAFGRVVGGFLNMYEKL
ncbi:hypothetical protein, conserved [Eimeria maxima]|uniref:Phytanoyl-CoA dioxygenase domain-containing protein n=1 Tax=Eimeria maxima TaxID=5804 RepID=U6MCQ6_EIMMA|nr:hypothetical protein, conserved [Eimeria maxima]CDJ61806.1 hypothetical protein, conserved [Eimeria maxima]